MLDPAIPFAPTPPARPREFVRPGLHGPSLPPEGKRQRAMTTTPESIEARDVARADDGELRWQALLVRIATGDEAAFAELYDATASIVHGVAARLVREREDAEDVTVHTFHDVWRRAASYDAARGRPSAWLRTLARSRAIDLLRSRRRGRVLLEEVARDLAAASPASPAEAPDDASHRSGLSGHLRAALRSLPADERRAIELAYYGGMSHSEVAMVLGEPLGTVKSRIRLGMARLRRALEAKDVRA